MDSYFYHLAKTASVILFIDVFYLLTMGILFRRMLGDIQGKPIDFRYVSAILVYFFLAYMLLETTSYKQAFFYGISIYAVYDLTNYAVFDRYSWKLGVCDILWGGTLFVMARYVLKNVF